MEHLGIIAGVFLALFVIPPTIMALNNNRIFVLLNYYLSCISAVYLIYGGKMKAESQRKTFLKQNKSNTKTSRFQERLAAAERKRNNLT